MKQSALWEGRVIAWFSCGAASLVAAKMAVEKYGSRCLVVNCDMRADEHPDNVRVFQDAERWLGVKILRIKSDRFNSVDEVFEATKYMAGVAGARCTTEMKKIPRRDFQDVADIHIFGYTVDEGRRIRDFEQANPELFLEWPLRDEGLTKDDCFDILAKERIKRSAMYDLGFKNANCIGCVKSTSPTYWNRIRVYYPNIFDQRVKRSRELNVRLVKITRNGEQVRIFLDELQPDQCGPEPEISCGPYCTTENL